MTFCKPAGKKPMNSEVLLRSLRSFRPLPTRSTFLDGVESVVAREGFRDLGFIRRGYHRWGFILAAAIPAVIPVLAPVAGARASGNVQRCEVGLCFLSGLGGLGSG